MTGELDGIALGDQRFDTCCVVGASPEFGTQENKVFLQIPLGYFDHSDGQMLVLVEALLEATLAAGHSDSLPDQGALDTRVVLTALERVQPIATYVQPESVEPDSPDDSLWQGYQGDEIIQTRACPLSDGGLMIRVDLEQLEYSGRPKILPPWVRTAEPLLGPLAGGNSIRVHGANFVEGADGPRDSKTGWRHPFSARRLALSRPQADGRFPHTQPRIDVGWHAR